MAFTEIKKVIGGLGMAAKTDVVTIARSEANGATQIGFSLDVAAALGVSSGDCVSLAAGTGEDDGWFRVTKAASGFKLTRNGDNDKRIKFSSAAILRHIKSLPTTEVRHVISGDALLIEIPARLRAPTLSVAA